MKPRADQARIAQLERDLGMVPTTSTMAADLDPFLIPDEEEPYSAPAFVRVRDKEMQKRQDAVTRSIPQLVKRYFGKDLMPFHKELFRRLFRMTAEETHYFWSFRWSDHFPGADTSDPDIQQVGMLPTEFGKSTIACIWFPILSLMEDPQAAHIVCCNNINEARTRTKVIRDTLEGKDPAFDQLLKDYPWLQKPDGVRWSADEFTIIGRQDQNMNPSVIAVGRGQRDIKSRRGKFIGDDLEGKEAMEAAERERTWNWITLEAIRCTEDPAFARRPLHMYVGTPFDVDSVYFRLNQAGFQQFKMPFRYPPLPHQRVGDLIWPAKKDKVALFRKLLPRQQFAIAMKLDPTGGDQNVLSMDRITELTSGDAEREPDNTRELHGFIFLDPAAGSKNKKVDYAGIGACRIYWPPEDELPWVEVWEPRVFKEGILEQVHLCAQLQARWNLEALDAQAQIRYPIIFETNGWQATTYSALFEQHHPEAQLIRHYTSPKKKWDKHMGITVVRTLARAGRLRIFSRDGEILDEEDDELEVKYEDPDVRQFRTEIRDLDDPNAHNHITAGVWFCIAYAYRQRRSGSFTLNSTGSKPGGYRPSVNLQSYRGLGRNNPARDLAQAPWRQ